MVSKQLRDWPTEKIETEFFVTLEIGVPQNGLGVLQASLTQRKGILFDSRYYISLLLSFVAASIFNPQEVS